MMGVLFVIIVKVEKEAKKNRMDALIVETKSGGVPSVKPEDYLGLPNNFGIFYAIGMPQIVSLSKKIKSVTTLLKQYYDY